MRIPLSYLDLPALKRHLKYDYAYFSASRRIELAAKALGFKSYASLLKALECGSIWVEPNDLVFLAESGVSPQPDANRNFSRCILRMLAEKVLESYPTLTVRGFDDHLSRSREEWRLSKAELDEGFLERRSEILYPSALDGIELSICYLESTERRNTINRDFSSYNLKHRVEDLVRKEKLYQNLTDYVANGVFITAAIVVGFQCKRASKSSLNAFFNISSGSIRVKAKRPLMTRGEMDAVFRYAISDHVPFDNAEIA